MLTAEWIIKQFEEWAPAAYAEEWDNVGLLIGEATQPVRKVLVALDATEDVINEAVSGGYDFLISHHPLVYNPINRITSADSTGRKILTLAKNGIGCFAAHTNLDKAEGGVNDCLAGKIGLTKLTPLVPELSPNGRDVPSHGIGRVGFLAEKMSAAAFAEHVKKALALTSLRFSGDTQKIVEKVGICGGDGSRYVENAIAQNCDIYITGDLRYHIVQDALESGIALLDITHYGGEIHVVPEIVSRLKNAANGALEIFPSSIDGQVFTSIDFLRN